VIDLFGDTRYHQWCSKQLRSELWTLERAALDLAGVSCPPPEDVYEADRHKSAIYLQRRKQRLREQTPALSPEDKALIEHAYGQRDRLNEEAGFVEYHVDHIIPLAKGGAHHPANLQVISARDNVRKGAKVRTSIK
jgi:5-methylcytosine-specific restriction endonuclease McrA